MDIYEGYEQWQVTADPILESTEWIFVQLPTVIEFDPLLDEALARQ